ncbi:hypothetical protein J3B02_001090 [Coemansia erecta]|nr:hypothetical protein J3B02_001090 [Coemansia erecta]KAJ2888654.1 hypothetical protein FB639_000492 [Coemansia asiatica]
MEQIRYVKIPLAETRTEPDTHVEYALNVQGPVRSWTVWHRYNDFVMLAYELTRELPGASTPAELPPKSFTSWFSKITTATSSMSGGSGSNSNAEFIEERRYALERYIQSMIMSEDDRWRTSEALQRFLAPTAKTSKYLAAKGNAAASNLSEAGSVDSDMGWVTPASWLSDYRDAEQIVRDVRQSIVRRENALTRNEVSVSHQSLLQAKRQLTGLGKAVRTLEQGLEQIRSVLTSGESLRRQDMLMRLSEERANLTRVVLGTGVVSGGSERQALLGGASAANNGSVRVLGRAGNGNSSSASSSYPMSGTISSAASGSQALQSGAAGPAQANAAVRPAPRSRRIFGNSNPPQETNETRGLDGRGLLQLQQERMQNQDQIASDLSAILRRQREMGASIGDELDLQNQMLSEFDQNLDQTGNKLAAAKRQTGRFT